MNVACKAMVAAGLGAMTLMAGCQQPGTRAGGRTQASGQTQTGGMQTRLLQDPVWGLPAATVTMPVGWKFDGVATHGDGCVMTLPDTRWAASSADGKTTIQYFPDIAYHYGPTPQDVERGRQQGCLVTQHWTPEDFLTNVLAPQLRPGVKPQVQVATTGDNPILKERQAMAAQLDRDAAQHGMRRQSQVGFGILVLQYAGVGGTPMVQEFQALFTCVGTQFPGGPQAIQCNIDQGMLFTGPESTLMDVIKNEPVQVKWTDAWVARMWDMLHTRERQQTAQTQQIIAHGNAQQNALHEQLMANQKAQYDAGVARNKATNDAMHQSMQATANHMGDVNDYHDPSTGQTYKVSNQYAHTYLDSSGRTIVQTNSAYAPGPDTVWQELQPR